MEGWRDEEERIEGGRASRGRRGAEMKESDLNRKEERGNTGEGGRRDKENECMSDEGWNEPRRKKSAGMRRRTGGRVGSNRKG